METTLERVLAYGERELWRAVPGQVVALLKRGTSILDALAGLDELPPADVYWHPKQASVLITLPDRAAVQQQPAFAAYQGALPEFSLITELDAPEDPDWISIKRGSEAWLNKPFTWAGALTGGPTPLTNTIVGGLLGGGLGYGAGTLIDSVLPKRYFKPNHFRRALGVIGGGLGTVGGLKDLYLNSQIAADAGKPLGWRALITPDSQLPISPNEPAVLSNRLKAGSFREKIFKAALDNLAAIDQLRPVPVDAFNQAIWNDVGKELTSSRTNPYGTKDPWGSNNQELHTPPVVGAAISSLVSGIQQQAGGASLLSPRHFISGLVGAGVDRTAAGVLTALGGMTPVAQNSLQNMGLWGGFMRGVAQSIFGN